MNQVDQAIRNYRQAKYRIRRRRYTFSRLLVRSFPKRVVPGAGVMGIDLAGAGVKPNFLGIGFPRSGTTTLYFTLGQHPEISLPVIGTNATGRICERGAWAARGISPGNARRDRP